MRDFKSGDINGDVNIIDSSKNENKLLVNCSNDELLLEEEHRKNILRGERKRKSKVTLKFFGFCAVLLLIAAGWYFINGKMDIVSTLTGGAGIALGVANLSQADKTTEFEMRQINALNEIHMILRERGVR